MEEPQKPQTNKPNVLTLVAIMTALIAVAGVAKLNTDVNDLTKKVEGINVGGAKQAAETQVDPNAPVSETITSGKNGFTVNIPNGWGPLYNDTSSDNLFITGQTQPTPSATAKTVIKRIEGSGSDSASVFNVILFDKGSDVSPPQGVAEDFRIGKEDGPSGKKYTYVYDKDALAGIGYQRYQGDRDYTYSFTTKSGKQLVVFYSVYGRDPRNYSETVDDIVRSIVVK